MEKENSIFIDKFVFYILVISCPILALIIAISLDYGKNDDDFLNRIKLISFYEILEILIIGISFIHWGNRGIKISVLIFFVFYIFVCAIVAYNKKDFLSRGAAIGLFANHYSLAIMQTSEESTARIDNTKWPDFSLAFILMIFKLLFILLLLFSVNTLISKINIKQNEYISELLEKDIAEEKTDENISLDTIPHINDFEYKIHFSANTNLFVHEEGNIVRLPQIAKDMKNILSYKPDQLFMISGYTADTPGDEYGKIELSKQRADIVKNLLVDFGVPADNMVCVYLGGTNKWGNNLTEKTRKQNRVVTIELK
jgi:hypothetical protein